MTGTRRVRCQRTVSVRRVRLALLALGMSAVVVYSGCTLVDLAQVPKSEAVLARYARVSGTVSADFAAAEWIIVFMAKLPCDDDWDALVEAAAAGRLHPSPDERDEETNALVDRAAKKAVLVENVVLRRPAHWYADLAPGCYDVGAFADLDRDYRYDDEPASRLAASRDLLLRLEEGQMVDGLELVIEEEARIQGTHDVLAEQIRSREARSHDEQLVLSMGAVEVVGDVTPLPDTRFSAPAGRLGYFEVNRFLHEYGVGIHFLEPYDPSRIPVLFVHGAQGYPQEFTTLVAGLDPRFQPWVASFPSGASLDQVAPFLSRTLTKLRLLHGFDEMAVVAHSMGGLVTRAVLFEQQKGGGPIPVRLFVSVATPWEGVPSAEAGVKSSPYVVPSWRDMAPGSPFLAELFYLDPEERSARRRLPDEVTFHAIFGVADTTVPVGSTIGWDAMREADQRWPLDEDHTSILRAERTSVLLAEMLAAAFP